MESPMCGLCLNKEGPLQLAKTLFTIEISNILQKCCDFLFQNGVCLANHICNKCWKSLKQFDEFCDTVRNVHGFAQVHYVENTKDELNDESIEYADEEELDDNAHISTEFSIKSMLSIEKDVDKNSALARRPVAMTVNVINSLEKQLQFDVIRISFDDLDYGKVSRFVNTDCKQCETKFQTFDEIHAHFLEKHKCPATWVCCNIELESAYDIHDHVRYHESIDDFRCAACFKCFLTSNKLQFHIRRNHLPIENDSYICSVKSCKKDCKSQRLLLNHQKTHISVECPYCTETISAVNYMTHVRNHTGTVSEKGRSSNEKGRANKKPKPSSNSKGRKVSGGKCKKSKVAPKKNPKPTTILSKKTLTLSFEQNDESGVVYCDICNMQFDRMSRVFIHRNKVHV